MLRGRSRAGILLGAKYCERRCSPLRNRGWLRRAEEILAGITRGASQEPCRAVPCRHRGCRGRSVLAGAAPGSPPVPPKSLHTCALPGTFWGKKAFFWFRLVGLLKRFAVRSDRAGCVCCATAAGAERVGEAVGS